ncbi:MAG: hypothetical protein JXR88_14445 [Clostridia bacterium]|nr:hypothetical protein [Clostridia bacterium]
MKEKLDYTKLEKNVKKIFRKKGAMSGITYEKRKVHYMNQYLTNAPFFKIRDITEQRTFGIVRNIVYGVIVDGKFAGEVELMINHTIQDVIDEIKNKFGTRVYFTTSRNHLRKLFDFICQINDFVKEFQAISNFGFQRIENQPVFYDFVSLLKPSGCLLENDIILKKHPKEIYGINAIETSQKDAFAFLNAFLDIGSKNFTYMAFTHFLSTILTTPLTEANARLRAPLLIYGSSGTRKTSYALALSNLTKRNGKENQIDANFNDTKTHIQIMLNDNKDQLTLVDDLHPGRSKREQDEILDKVQTYVRSIADGADKGRANVDISMKEDLPARGNMIITSESDFFGDSLVNRIISLEMNRTTLSLDALSLLQENLDIASTGLKYFIEWFLEDYDNHVSSMKNLFMRKRQSMNKANLHGRVLEQIVICEIVFSLYVKYGFESELIKKKKAMKMLRVMQCVIKDYMKNMYVKGNRDKPVFMYLHAIFEMMDAKELSLYPFGYDSRDKRKDGIESDSHLYLIDGIVFQKVVAYWKRQGVTFPHGLRDIHHLLLENKLIEVNPAEEGRVFTKKCNVYNDSRNRLRALKISKYHANEYLKEIRKDMSTSFKFKMDYLDDLQSGFTFKFKKSVAKRMTERREKNQQRSA